ncbi:ABC transporter ATP-binding protein [Streptomyces longispororuber]|uniref:ABC transporter ATP-binding protein n=1 Tax=Streptomyces longispororuber TaxID=68230 RepID=UPI00210A9A91|nr:ATP-binding cassette domain-containing protein [Streptomyces longispororuber]MCQ4207542.1 ATP-binding cassette domain-containing protein [Streptomyces longispororuber]
MSLHLRDVTVTLGDGESAVTPLRSLDAAFAPRAVTALVGPSGSGKSTLLAVAGTLLKPDSGQVLLSGTDLAALSTADRARERRRRIGYVFQSGNLLTGLTARQQLLAAASVSGRSLRSGSGLRARADELLDDVGLAHRRDHRTDTMSGGERQRVALARALLLTPELLLIDEPTAAVDRERASDLAALIRRTTRHHDCVTVVATHDPVMEAAADEILDLTRREDRPTML